MNNWYDKEKNTFTLVKRSGLLLYDSHLMDGLPSLEFFNLIHDDYYSVKTEWLISKSDPKYDEACSVINKIDETFNKVHTVADECCETLYEKFEELNDLSVRNDKFSPKESIYKFKI